MKIRHTLFLFTILFLLTSCNFTLAEDVTPPPNYVPPTPAPTMGPLYPSSAPDAENGEALYIENCAPCHGVTGMGDGPQSAMLQGQDITVPPLGSPDFAQAKAPAAWFQIVTQGNLERFMPPFTSLSDQQRWDVVAYAISLRATPEQLEEGKALCADCTEFFNDQKMMSALSDNDLVNLMKNGEGDIPAFGKDFTDDEAMAVATYLRSLTFAPQQHAAPTVVPATQASDTNENGTPSVETTPQAKVTPEATEITGMGTISGSIENQTGTDLPSDTKVTLRGYTHGTDMSAAPEEIVTLEGVVNSDGSFVFEKVETYEGLIFLAEVAMDGQTYQSDFAIVEAGMTDLSLPAITIHATTDDFSVLKIDSLQLFFDLANADAAQVFGVYTITNASDKTVVVKMGNAEEVPFLSFPAGAEGLGYEATQDTAPFMPIDGGFAMPPSTTPYGLIAYSSLPNGDEISISQPALLPIGEITLLVPEGIKVEGDSLTDGGTQPMMDSMVFHIYTSSGLAEGETLDFTMKGQPQETTAVNADVTQNKNLLIGIGALGVALILAGGWMFWRDRKREESVEDEEEEEDGEFEDPESLMDAIIALDDLHRAGKIPDEAYHQRRRELKDALKRNN